MTYIDAEGRPLQPTSGIRRFVTGPAFQSTAASWQPHILQRQPFGGMAAPLVNHIPTGSIPRGESAPRFAPTVKSVSILGSIPPSPYRVLGRSTSFDLRTATADPTPSSSQVVYGSLYGLPVCRNNIFSTKDFLQPTAFTSGNCADSPHVVRSSAAPVLRSHLYTTPLRATMGGTHPAPQQFRVATHVNDTYLKETVSVGRQRLERGSSPHIRFVGGGGSYRIGNPTLRLSGSPVLMSQSRFGLPVLRETETYTSVNCNQTSPARGPVSVNSKLILPSQLSFFSVAGTLNPLANLIPSPKNRLYNFCEPDSREIASCGTIGSQAQRVSGKDGGLGTSSAGSVTNGAPAGGGISDRNEDFSATSVRKSADYMKKETETGTVQSLQNPIRTLKIKESADRAIQVDPPSNEASDPSQAVADDRLRQNSSSLVSGCEKTSGLVERSQEIDEIEENSSVGSSNKASRPSGGNACGKSIRATVPNSKEDSVFHGKESTDSQENDMLTLKKQMSGPCDTHKDEAELFPELRNDIVTDQASVGYESVTHLQDIAEESSSETKMGSLLAFDSFEENSIDDAQCLSNPNKSDTELDPSDMVPLSCSKIFPSKTGSPFPKPRSSFDSLESLNPPLGSSLDETPSDCAPSLPLCDRLEDQPSENEDLRTTTRSTTCPPPCTPSCIVACVGESPLCDGFSAALEKGSMVELNLESLDADSTCPRQTMSGETQGPSSFEKVEFAVEENCDATSTILSSSMASGDDSDSDTQSFCSSSERSCHCIPTPRARSFPELPTRSVDQSIETFRSKIEPTEQRETPLDGNRSLENSEAAIPEISPSTPSSNSTNVTRGFPAPSSLVDVLPSPSESSISNLPELRQENNTTTLTNSSSRVTDNVSSGRPRTAAVQHHPPWFAVPPTNSVVDFPALDGARNPKVIRMVTPVVTAASRATEVLSSSCTAGNPRPGGVRVMGQVPQRSTLPESSMSNFSPSLKSHTMSEMASFGVPFASKSPTTDVAETKHIEESISTAQQDFQENTSNAPCFDWKHSSKEHKDLLFRTVRDSEPVGRSISEANLTTSGPAIIPCQEAVSFKQGDCVFYSDEAHENPFGGSKDLLDGDLSNGAASEFNVGTVTHVEFRGDCLWEALPSCPKITQTNFIGCLNEAPIHWLAPEAPFIKRAA